MNIKIRRMEMKDIDAVCEMEEEAFSMPWHRESFIEMMNNPDALYLTAEYDDSVTPVGCAGFIKVLDEGNICNIVVNKEYRRLGIGDRLVKSMIEMGREQYGINAFTLEVRVSNMAAIGLYEKLGFINEGVRPGFYDRPREDAYIYWLRF